MKIHCLQHLENETLGNIGTWISLKNHKLTKTLLYREDSSFPDPGEFDLLLIMGGTMSVYREEEYPWLKPEKDFVRRSIEAGKPILGSCFGAQMLAEVLGGEVTRNKFKEIGWHRVRSVTGEKPLTCKKTLTVENVNSGLSSPDLPAGMFPEFTAFMWHGDTFEIPASAIRLFESEACPNQGFIYNGNVLGLQFHPEADKKWIENLIADQGHEIVEGKYIQKRAEILGKENVLESSRDLAFELMDWFEEKVEGEVKYQIKTEKEVKAGESL